MKKLAAVILSLVLALGAFAAGFAEEQADLPGALDSLFGLSGDMAEKDSVAGKVASEREAFFENLDVDLTGDEVLDELLYDLLLVELTDDEYYDDLKAAVKIAEAVIGDETNIDDVVTMLRVLSIYDADVDEDDPDIAAILALLTYIYGDGENFDQYVREILSFIEDFKSDKYHDLDLDFQEFALEELMDDDDLQDATFLLGIYDHFVDDDFTSWDNGRALAFLAYLDTVDDDSYEDLKELNAYAEQAIDEDEYSEFLETYENILSFLNNGIYDNADPILIRLAAHDFLDDDDISDFETLLELFDAAGDGDADAFAVLFYGILMADYYDDFNRDDVDIILDYIKEIDEIDEADEKLYQAALHALDYLDYFDEDEQAD